MGARRRSTKNKVRSSRDEGKWEADPDAVAMLLAYFGYPLHPPVPVPIQPKFMVLP